MSASEVGASPPATTSPPRSTTQTSSAVSSPRTAPVGVIATCPPARALTFPFVPWTRPSAARRRAAAATWRRSSSSMAGSLARHAQEGAPPRRGLPRARADGGARARRADAAPRARGALDHRCRRPRRDPPRPQHGLQAPALRAGRDRLRRGRRRLPGARGLRHRPPRRHLQGGRAAARRLRRRLPRPHRAHRRRPRQARHRLAARLPPGPLQRALPGRGLARLGGRRRRAAGPAAVRVPRQLPGDARAAARLRSLLERRPEPPGALRRRLAPRRAAVPREPGRPRLRPDERAVAGHGLAAVREPGRLPGLRRDDAGLHQAHDRGDPLGRPPHARLLRAAGALQRRRRHQPRRHRRRRRRLLLPRLLPDRRPGRGDAVVPPVRRPRLPERREARGRDRRRATAHRVRRDRRRGRAHADGRPRRPLHGRLAGVALLRLQRPDDLGPGRQAGDRARPRQAPRGSQPRPGQAQAALAPAPARGRRHADVVRLRSRHPRLHARLQDGARRRQGLVRPRRRDRDRRARPPVPVGLCGLHHRRADPLRAARRRAARRRVQRRRHAERQGHALGRHEAVVRQGQHPAVAARLGDPAHAAHAGPGDRAGRGPLGLARGGRRARRPRRRARHDRRERPRAAAQALRPPRPPLRARPGARLHRRPRRGAHRSLNRVTLPGRMAYAAGETLAGPREGRAERSRILNALLDDLDPRADGAVAAIWGEIPAYGEQDERFAADVRDQVLRHYRANLHSFLEERDVTRADVAFTRGAATRRARDGFGLEDYLNAYRVGQQVLWQAIVAAAGPEPAGQAAALTLATPVMRYADFASTHVAHLYVEFQQYVVADADRERRALLEPLLAGQLPPLAAASAYGIGPDTRMLVAVAVPVPRGPGVDAAGAALARAGLGAARTLVVARHGEIVAVPTLTGGDEAAVCARLEDVHEQLRQDGTALAMGVSTAAGAGEVPRAYQEARSALDCVADDGGVAALPRLSAFDYLARRADDTARRLVDERLRRFLAEDRDRGGVLTATLRVFAGADLNLRLTAERLQIHPNTAQYRLGRIEERSGRNPRHVADLVDLLVALALI